MIKLPLKLNLNNFFFLLVVASSLIISFDLTLSLKSFPLTEGWWETYGWMKQKGLEPYVDYNFKFTPLFVYLNSILYFRFDESFLNIRLFGCFVHFLYFVLLYIYLLKISKDRIASLLGAFSAISLVIVNPVFIPKDYHTYESVFILLALISLLYIEKNLFIYFVLSSISLFLLILIKQNVGLLLAFSFLTLSVFFLKRGKYIVILSVLFVCFSVYLIEIFLIPNLWSAFIGNDAKGSLLTVLTRFLFDKQCILIEFSSIVLLGLMIAYDQKVKLHNHFLINKKIVFLFLVILLAITIFYSFLLISISLAYLLYSFYKKNYLISIPLAALAYAGTITAGYNYVSMEIAISLTLAILISNINEGEKKVFTPYVFFIFFTLFIFSKVLKPSYDWWNYKLSPISKNFYKLPFDQLKGIESDKSTYQILNYLNLVKADLEVEDRVFAYPHIPIFYLLLNKLPITDPVLWFDVTSTSQSKNVIKTLTETKPKYIFWLKPPRSVYEGHYMLRRSDPAMFFIDKVIIDLVSSGEYEVDLATATFIEGSGGYTSPIGNKSTTIKSPIQDLDCDLASCNLDGSGDFSFRSLNDMIDFIENNKMIVESNYFIFYSLKRKRL